MTAKKVDLALAFLQSHPLPAAALLEQQPVEEVIRFLQEVPHTYAAPVLESMLPQYVAQLCKQMPCETAAGFLSRMEISLAASVLRHLDSGLRAELLDQLTEKTKISCKLLLDYAEDQVGSWMLAQVATLPSDCTVAEALARVAADTEHMHSDVVYVVDREANMQGMVYIRQLLLANPETPLSAVMLASPEVISGRTTLRSAAEHDGWHSSDALPVINRHHRLVGLLRHANLRKGIEQTSSEVATPHSGDPLTSLFEVYGGSLLAIFSAVGGMLGIESKKGEWS